MTESSTIDYGIDFKWQTYPPTRPELDPDGYDTWAPDVVVVGAGPVGLTIAAGLTRLGVRTLVLESDNAVCRSSRASGISQHTFEVINRVAPGAGDKLASQGIPTLGSETYFGHRLVLRQESAPIGETQGKYPPNTYLSQWNIEQALVDVLADRRDVAEIRWQARVTHLEHGPDGAEVTVVSPDGSSYRIRAPWIVATDGSRSIVRNELGLRMTGQAYEVFFVVVDAQVAGTPPPPIRRVWFDPNYLPGGLLLRHMSPDGIWRLDFQLPIGADVDAALRPERVEQLIRDHLADIGFETDLVRPIWISAYTARALSLDNYRHGRVLFAGDAAHLVPIFGGFGLNSGIDDADNLQWKLALVVRGGAEDALLDSYDTERAAAVHSSLTFVTRAAEFMTPTSVESERLREAALSLAAQGNQLTADLSRHRPFHPVPYPESSRCLPDADEFDSGPGPGEQSARGWVEDDTGQSHYLLDLLGAPLTALVLMPDITAAGDLAAALRAALALHGENVSVVSVTAGPSKGYVYSGSPQLFARFGAPHGAVYLLRADTVVAARWSRPAVTDVARAVATVLGVHASMPGLLGEAAR